MILDCLCILPSTQCVPKCARGCGKEGGWLIQYGLTPMKPSEDYTKLHWLMFKNIQRCISVHMRWWMQSHCHVINDRLCRLYVWRIPIPCCTKPEIYQGVDVFVLPNHNRQGIVDCFRAVESWKSLSRRLLLSQSCGRFTFRVLICYIYGESVPSYTIRFWLAFGLDHHQRLPSRTVSPRLVKVWLCTKEMSPSLLRFRNHPCPVS